MTGLSIIILTCNQRIFTERVLLSLDGFMQATPDAEVIIVDNGSSDGTSAAIAGMGLKWCARLKYISLAENIGVAAGRNVGIMQSSRDVIMLLDNDTIADGESISYMYDRLMSDPTIGILAPSLWSPEGKLQDSAKPYPGLGLKLRHFISQKWHRSDEIQKVVECEPFYVIGACQMFRHEILQKIGLLDERIFYGPEDADFCMRVRDAGFRIIYDPYARIIHDWQRATSRRRFSRLSFLHVRGLLHFYLKHRRLF